jgi:hypothetical protein
MGRNRNVQQQVEGRAAQIMDVARSFSEHPDRFYWLSTLLAAHTLEAHKGLLVQLQSTPDQGCWVHSGVWLTSSGRFVKFTAEEAYGARALEKSGRLQDAWVEDVTEHTSIDEHVPGVGRSFGWLALEALRKSGKAE